METIKKEAESHLMYPEGDGCYLRGIQPRHVYLAEDYDALKESHDALKDALQQINIDLNILKKNILYESERLENTRFDGYADVIGSWISLNEQAIEKAL